jgi:8-oxo-dGTP pyrophosphatase MutT (NUDIX family)
MTIPEPGEMPNPQVKAAGGVIWRAGSAGEVDLVVIHRAAYDDWSLPKGKLEEGETEAEAALREVREETGLICRIGPALPSTTYLDRFGRTKAVRYWALDVVGGELAAANEVDQARWVDLAGARELLSYERDLVVLEAFAEMAGKGMLHPSPPTS